MAAEATDNAAVRRDSRLCGQPNSYSACLISHYFYWPHIILLRPRCQGIGHHTHTHSPSPFIGIESNQIAEEPNFMFG
uniref:Uncharacterized protein n=1 Tax=Oryza sativa subsp. japonica TaxID=39947 RepID=Q6ZLN5_ORYSJ|nr:hypothetical protein [Oryza sativa Japonica Group]BAD31954.1 hypothetical protein [Oryza sativa Japonica Group]